MKEERGQGRNGWEGWVGGGWGGGVKDGEVVERL